MKLLFLFLLTFYEKYTVLLKCTLTIFFLNFFSRFFFTFPYTPADPSQHTSWKHCYTLSLTLDTTLVFVSSCCFIFKICFTCLNHIWHNVSKMLACLSHCPVSLAVNRNVLLFICIYQYFLHSFCVCASVCCFLNVCLCLSHALCWHFILSIFSISVWTSLSNIPFILIKNA